jgi:insulysin
LSYLISEGLALELSSGYDHELWNFSNFYIDITLTKKGLENYEKVIEAVFQYAQIVRDRGVQEYLFNEIKRVGEINFDFADKSSPMNYTLKLSSKMQLFEDELV